MRKRRVLICDNEDDQLCNVKSIVQECDLEAVCVEHHKKVSSALDLKWPIHLLILDLGYLDENNENSFSGWECLKEIEEKYPFLPVLIYSQAISAFENKEAGQDLRTIVEQIRERNCVKEISGPHEDKEAVKKKILQIIGEDWLEDDELWLLHLSDLQMGGKGLLERFENPPIELAQRINEDITSYLTGVNGGIYPHLCILTGDITYHGRPQEYGLALEFCKNIHMHIVSKHPNGDRLRGRYPNIIAIPGNHDLNWDITRGINLHKNDSEKYEYNEDIHRAELEFLLEYGWHPYINSFGNCLSDDPLWIFHPGYKIIDLHEEIGVIFVCINSSKWSVSHNKKQKKNIEVPSNILLEIQNILKNKKRPNNKKGKTVIFLSHHSLDGATENEHRLHVRGRRFRESIEELYNNIGFQIALTGHIHEQVISPLDTQGTNESIAYNIGAGTIASDELDEYNNPSFNLIRLWGRSKGEKSYQKMTVHVLGYDGSRFTPKAVFDKKQKSYKDYKLISFDGG